MFLTYSKPHSWCLVFLTKILFFSWHTSMLHWQLDIFWAKIFIQDTASYNHKYVLLNHLGISHSLVLKHEIFIKIETFHLNEFIQEKLFLFQQICKIQLRFNSLFFFGNCIFHLHPIMFCFDFFENILYSIFPQGIHCRFHYFFRKCDPLFTNWTENGLKTFTKVENDAIRSEATLWLLSIPTDSSWDLKILDPLSNSTKAKWCSDC